MLVNAYACHISIIIWSNDDDDDVSVNRAQNYTAKAGTFLPFGEAAGCALEMILPSLK